jgi:hypothetical protein
MALRGGVAWRDDYDRTRVRGGSFVCLGPAGDVVRRVQDSVLAAAVAGELVLILEHAATQITEVLYDHVVKELAEELEFMFSLESGNCGMVPLRDLHGICSFVSSVLMTLYSVYSIIHLWSKNINRPGGVFSGYAADRQRGRLERAGGSDRSCGVLLEAARRDRENDGQNMPGGRSGVLDAESITPHKKARLSHSHECVCGSEPPGISTERIRYVTMNHENGSAIMRSGGEP